MDLKVSADPLARFRTIDTALMRTIVEKKYVGDSAMGKIKTKSVRDSAVVIPSELEVRLKPEVLSEESTRYLIEGRVTSELIAYVCLGLNSGIISPDILLKKSFSVITDSSYLILVALAIRYGAELNNYFPTTLGHMHCFIYAMISVSNNKATSDVFMSVAAMLLASGSSVDMPAFMKEKVENDTVKAVPRNILTRKGRNTDGLEISKERGRNADALDVSKERGRNADALEVSKERARNVGSFRDINDDDNGYNDELVPENSVRRVPARRVVDDVVGRKVASKPGLFNDTADIVEDTESDEVVVRSSKVKDFSQRPSKSGRRVSPPRGKSSKLKNYQEDLLEKVSYREPEDDLGVPSSKELRYTSNEVAKKRNEITVAEYLTQISISQNDITLVNNIKKLNFDKQLQTLKPEYNKFIAIILDREDLLPRIPSKETKFFEADKIIQAFSKRLYTKITPVIAKKQGLITAAIVRYNFEFVQYILKAGANVSYNQINQLLLTMKYTSQNKLNALTRVSETTLTLMVEYGVVIDTYQYSLLLSILKDRTQKIVEAYNEPRWMKECRTASTPSSDFKKLTFGLQIDEGDIDADDKSNICVAMEEYYKGDKSELIESAVRRRKAALSGGRGSLANNDLETTPETEKVLELPGPAITSYRDENNEIRYIPSELYQTALKSGTDPYDGTKLSANVIRKIKENLNVLIRNQINPADVMTFSTAINTLNQNDKMGIDKKILNDFADLARVNGIKRSTLNQVDSSMIQQLFDELGIRAKVTELSPDHASMTFVQTIYPLIYDDTDKAAIFFSRLKDLLVSRP